MSFSVIYNAIKSYLTGFLTFAVCFSVASVFLWNEYKEVQINKESVSTKLLSLKDAEIKLEKEKSLLQLKLKEKEFELSKKEAQMDKVKTDLEEKNNELKKSLSNAKEIKSDSIENKEKMLNALIEQYESKVKEVNVLHSYYSNEARKAKAEELILKAMNDFSALGVNMRRPDWCDREYMSRYNQGKVLIDQISALNSKYLISDEYDWFVGTHTNSSILFGDECKTDNSSNVDAASSTDS